MRWVTLVVLIYAVPAAADSPSPRVAALAAKKTTEDAFWKQLAIEGTPIVEDVKDPKGKLLVTFVFRAAPAVKHVAAYGTPAPNLAGYVPLERVGATNTFAYSALVDPTARFQYFLAPNDNFGPPTGMGDFAKRAALWQPDIFNKRPQGTFASTIQLPKAPAQPWLVPKRDTKPGDLVVHNVKSKTLANERMLVVYTPPGFVKTGPKYPLVVMFDGPANVPNLGLPIMLDELIAAKQIPPVVVAMIGNAERGKELPANEKFADFVALDVVPWVRKTYHATSDPARTVVAGISYGGIAAAYAALQHPAVYGNVLSQSGSYWYSGDDDPEAEWHSRQFAARPKLPLRWWMECGALELGSPKPESSQVGSNRHMRDVLKAKGYEVTYREYIGGHEYVNWRGTISDGLVALLAKPPKLGKAPASSSKPGGVEIDAGKKSIIHVVMRGAVLDGGAPMLAKLKTMDAALVNEEQVNLAAYALMEQGRAREALPLLEWNVERFPKSQNVHDSLAEVHYLLGDRAKAAASYKRAFELDPKNDNAKKMSALLR